MPQSGVRVGFVHRIGLNASFAVPLRGIILTIQLAPKNKDILAMLLLVELLLFEIHSELLLRQCIVQAALQRNLNILQRLIIPPQRPLLLSLSC